MTPHRTVTIRVSHAVTARQVETILFAGEEDMTIDQAVWLVTTELRIHGLGAVERGVAHVGQYCLADPDACARRLAAMRALAAQAFPELYDDSADATPAVSQTPETPEVDR